MSKITCFFHRTNFTIFPNKGVGLFCLHSYFQTKTHLVLVLCVLWDNSPYNPSKITHFHHSFFALFFFQSEFRDEIDSNWIHDKLPQSLVKSMNMLKNGGMAIMPEFQFQPNNRGTYITGGTSLDFKLAKLRNEMVSLEYYRNVGLSWFLWSVSY